MATAPTGDIAPEPMADGPMDTWWMSTDYLIGWIRRTHLPPLVTTSPAGTPQTAAGVLGQPGTTILFGNERANGDCRSGVRMNLGGWLADEHAVGIDFGFFLVESRADLFSASSDGSLILARPFLDASKTPAVPTSNLIAFPGLSTGSVAVSANSGMFYGAHLDLQEAILENQNFRLKSLAGYRFLRFDDGLEIQQTLFPTGPGFFPGTRLDAMDAFAAHNTFHGGEIGLITQFFGCRWSLDFLAKIAFGNLQRDVIIAGNNVVSIPGSAPVSSPGGLLAQVTNIGERTSNDWVGAPEIGVNVGWNATTNLRLRAGYTLLLLYDVARASDQVDLTVNANLLQGSGVGPLRPAFNLERSTIWLQTLNLGAELTF
jgi:hypothetical protein